MHASNPAELQLSCFHCMPMRLTAELVRARRRSPNRWRWNAALAPGGAARLTVLPHEAVLLNSLRRLLAVVPQTEHTIALWAGGPAPAPPTPSGSVHPASPATQGKPGGGLPFYCTCWHSQACMCWDDWR